MADTIPDPDILIEPNRLLLAVLTSLPDVGVAVVDHDLVLRFAGGSALERRGWNLEAVVDRPLRDLMPAASLEHWLPGFRAALDGRSTTIESPSIDTRGVFRAELSPLRTADGAIAGALIVMREVSAELEQRRALELTDHHNRLLAENATDLVSLHDAEGVYLYASPAAIGLIGYTPEELVGRRAVEFIHPDDVRPSVSGDGSGELLGVPDESILTYRMRHRDGHDVWVETVTRRIRDASGAIAEIHCATRDITDRRTLLAAEQAAHERFRVAFDEAPIGMALISLDGRWLRVNQAICEITGWPAEELLTKTFQDITHPDDLHADLSQLDRLVAGEIGGYEMEKRYFTAAGEQIWVLLTVALVRDADGEPEHFISQVQDISERKRMEESLHHLADHDPLTGLWNRRRFEEELHRQLARSRRTGETAALLMFDLDNFKYVNDTLGHKVGDDLIRHTGRAVRDALRETDAVARLGGDEFAVLLPGVTAGDAVATAEKVCETVRSRPIPVGDGEVHATASVGISLLTGATASEQDALIEADLAMYEAKARGRNGVVAYEDQLDAHRQLSHGMVWSQKLSQAVADERFVLHAQPIVDTAEGRPMMYELLLRMIDDDGSLIGPAAFVYTAERFGLMRQIDRWVLRRAVELLHEYRAPKVRLSVNLSGRSVTDPSLPDYIESLFRRTQVDPRRLTVELTETEAIANMEQAKRLARRLHRLGCLVALDDFGSGFASFSYLKEIPIDFLKIDGEFVRHFLESPTDQLVVRAVHDVAQGMGKHTIAEYVEDDQTRAALAALGIDFAQGHLFGRPRAIEAVLGPPATG